LLLKYIKKNDEPMKERGVEQKKCIPLDALKWGKKSLIKKIEDIWLHFRDFLFLNVYVVGER